MPWTPTFWIKLKDYESLKEKLEHYDAYIFPIASIRGIVLAVDAESTRPHEALHDIVETVPHWVLNGESQGCDDCVGWGEQITQYQNDK